MDILWTGKIDCPASADAKVIVIGLVPPVLLAASRASRNEIVPSGPGLAISACTLDVSPSTLSLTFVTVTMMGGAGRGRAIGLGRGVGLGLVIERPVPLSLVLVLARVR